MLRGIPTDAKGKTVTNTIEERGIYVARPQHPHNGYYAGDFSGQPLRLLTYKDGQYQTVVVRAAS